MRNTLLLIITSILFLISFNSNAQNIDILWKIKNPDNNITSYIIGVKHKSCKKDSIDIKIRNQIRPLLAECKVLIQEPTEGDDISTKELQKLIRLKEGQTIESIFNKDEYELIKSICKKQGIQLKNGFSNILPILLKSALINSFDKSSCDLIKSIESEVLEISQRQNKKIVSVESAGEAIKPYYSIPLEKQKRDLLEFCKDQTGVITQNTLYYDSYSIGIEKIYIDTYKYCEYLAGKQFAKSNIDERNINWMNVIIPLIKVKSSFIIVGSGHLGSKNGIIKLLEKSNFELESITIE